MKKEEAKIRFSANDMERIRNTPERPCDTCQASSCLYCHEGGDWQELWGCELDKRGLTDAFYAYRTLIAAQRALKAAQKSCKELGFTVGEGNKLFPVVCA